MPMLMSGPFLLDIRTITLPLALMFMLMHPLILNAYASAYAYVTFPLRLGSH